MGTEIFEKNAAGLMGKFLMGLPSLSIEVDITGP